MDPALQEFGFFSYGDVVLNRALNTLIEAGLPADEYRQTLQQHTNNAEMLANGLVALNMANILTSLNWQILLQNTENARGISSAMRELNMFGQLTQENYLALIKNARLAENLSCALGAYRFTNETIPQEIINVMMQAPAFAMELPTFTPEGRQIVADIAGKYAEHPNIMALVRIYQRLDKVKLVNDGNAHMLLEKIDDLSTSAITYFRKLRPSTQQDVDNLVACKHQLPDFLEALSNDPGADPRELVQNFRAFVTKAALS